MSASTATFVPRVVLHAVPQIDANTAASEWDAYVASRPRATLYHLHGWKTVAERAYGIDAPFLSVRDGRGGLIRGVLPLFRLPRPFAPYLTSGLFGAYGPLLADEEHHARALLDAARALVEEGRGKFLHLKLLGDLPPDATFARRDIWVTMRLTLPQPDEAALWRSLRDSLRSDIRHAQHTALGGSLRHGDLDGFYDVLSENMHHKGSPMYGRRFFEELRSSLGTHTDVLTLHLDGRAVSGAFVASFGGAMYVPFASSRPSVFPMRPNHLLYWEILRLSQQLGLRTLDFGSSLRDSSGLMFKRRWGARPEPVSSYLWAEKGVVPAIEPGDSALARATVRLWKRLPRFLTEALGPTVIQWIA